MYYHFDGELCLAEAHTAVIDCGGVGYALTVSDITVAQIANKIGKRVKLYAYLAHREDAMELFGFHSMQEKVAFMQLIGVSGVGPKVAISVLSTLTPEQFAAAVISGDTKTLSSAKGLGKKGAERIVLELQEKLAKEYGTKPLTASAPANIKSPGKLSDATNALLVLGYTKAEANEALSGIDTSLSLEDMITSALRKLMK